MAWAPKCELPTTGTWVDVCKVKDPAGLEELLKARCEAYEGYWQQSTYVPTLHDADHVDRHSGQRGQH